MYSAVAAFETSPAGQPRRGDLEQRQNEPDVSFVHVSQSALCSHELFHVTSAARHFVGCLSANTCFPRRYQRQGPLAENSVCALRP